MSIFVKGNKYGFKHGDTGTRLHNIWKGMRYRCNNKDFKGYGEKNIRMCKEWNDFKIFKEWSLENGYNDNLTIERKEIDRDYCPENCEWIPNARQGDNTSRSIYVTAFGETKRLTEWVKDDRCKVKINILWTRIFVYHWDVEKAIYTEKQKPAIKYNNEEKTLTEWAKEYNIPQDTLWYRIFKAKWSIEKAFETPVKKGK